jgi:hypothetical protein
MARLELKVWKMNETGFFKGHTMRLRTLCVALVSCALALAVPGESEAVTIIDFSGLAPGASITGPGTVHPDLDIHTTAGAGVAVFPGVSPAGYGAPNGSGSVINNGVDATFGGFSDTVGRIHDFVFDLSLAADSFSVRVLDWGDFNQGNATSHSVTLQAFDSASILVDSTTFSFTSDAAVNPSTGSQGNLFLTGDAISATPGQAGNLTLSLLGSGIRKVEFLWSHNGSRPANAASDPNIGFDKLEIGFISVPEPSTNLLFGALLPSVAMRWWRRRA